MAEENQKGTSKAYQLMKKVYRLIKKTTGSDAETVLAELSVDVDETEVLELSQTPGEIKAIQSIGTTKTPVTFIGDKFELSNEQIAMIMETVPVGILTLNKELKVNVGYSAKCVEIFGLNNFEGSDFIELLGVTQEQEAKREELQNYLKALQQNEDSAENPFEEFELLSQGESPEDEEESKWLHCQIANTSNDNLLIIIENITDLKKSNDEIDKIQLKNTQLESAILDSDLFCELSSKMVITAREIESTISGLSEAASLKDIYKILYNQILTIKNIAASFARYAIADACSDFLSLIEDINNEDSIDEDAIASINDSYNRVNDELNNMTEETKLLLDIDVNNEIETMIRLNASNVKNQIDTISDMELDDTHKKEILANLNTLRQVPVYKGLGLSLKMIPGIIEHLGKEITLNVEDNDTLIDYYVAEALNKPIIKLVQNVIECGIDSPEDRFDRNKPEGANITMSIYNDEDGLTIEITDDGEGLNPEEVKASAIEKNILSQEDADNIPEEDILDTIIFNPDYANENPGQGYGSNMHEISDEIRENLKGDIFIDSVHGQGTTFIIKLSQLEMNLEKTVSKRVYGCYGGRYYLFLFDAEGDCQSKKIAREDVPAPVIDKWISNGTLTE